MKGRWKKYFQELFNEENPHEIGNEAKIEGPVENVTDKKVKNRGPGDEERRGTRNVATVK